MDIFQGINRFERLLPDELLGHIRGNGMVFLPIGSMEWHGPHLCMGVDTCHTYAVSLQVAQVMNGVVHPPLYMGTETRRSPKTLRKIGFTGKERITGMDFPLNSLLSLYCTPGLFRRTVAFHVAGLRRMGFRYIFLMNGHGADAQNHALGQIAKRYSASGKCLVRSIFVLFDDGPARPGHAGLAETALMQYLQPDSVGLERLRPKGKLKNTEYAIVDSETFVSGSNEDGTVRYDPRNATAALGERIMEYEVSRCIELIQAYIKQEE